MEECSAEITRTKAVTTDELVALYEAVGWSTYTRAPDLLADAIANSSIVVIARDSLGVLVGLARGLSDDAAVFYLQDILVRPDHQRTGIGRELLTVCLERYDHVHQKVLLTDDEVAQRRFYESFGYRRTSDVEGAALHAYVRFDA